MATTHKKYGGSKIELISLCSMVPTETQGIPDVPGPAAERGTRIHAWLERYLKNDLKAKAKTEQEKAEAALGAVAGQAIKEALGKLGFTLEHCHIEVARTFPGFDEIAGGISDLDGHKMFGDLVVVDLKTGDGQVFPDNWPQGDFYGVTKYFSLSEFERSTLNHFHKIIVQLVEGEAQVRIHTEPAEVLAAKYDQFYAVIHKAETAPEYNPGSHCQEKFCAARSTCQARIAYLNDRTNGLLDQALAGQMDDPRGRRLTDLVENAAAILDMIDNAKKVLIAIKQANPAEYPEWELKPNYSHRAWENVAYVKKYAKELGLKTDDIEPRKLISPADFDKLGKKIDGYVCPPTETRVTSYSLVKAKEDKLDALAAPKPVPTAVA